MHRTRFFRNLTLSSLICVLALAGLDCGRKPEAKHYPLHGRVIAVDRLGHELIIDHDSIPGFMEAMTMPYPVRDNAMLQQVGPGDEIRADLKVEGERISIDKVEVIKKAAPGSTLVPKPMHVPQTGEQAPDFVLSIKADSTFASVSIAGRHSNHLFSTRCRLNDYGPRMKSNFADLNRFVANDPPLYAKGHLLSISFDPEHDTAEALRSYGSACTEGSSREDFKHWEFTGAPAQEIKRRADFLEFSIRGLATESRIL